MTAAIDEIIKEASHLLTATLAIADEAETRFGANDPITMQMGELSLQTENLLVGLRGHRDAEVLGEAVRIAGERRQ